MTGKQIQISNVDYIAGPRAGAILLYAGLDADKLLDVMLKSEMAKLRQLVPWDFPGDPQAYMAGRAVRLEAGWPKGYAETMVRLSQLGQHVKHVDQDGRWIVGKDEYGRTVVAGLSDASPHFLIAGQSGSGKSVALRGAVTQLARDPLNRVILCDGKHGEGLSALSRLSVAPVADDGATIRSALSWACTEMRHRYEAGGHEGRIVVVFDEFQEFAKDAAISGLMARIAAQGRAAGVHLLAATQHPSVDSFGDKGTRRNLSGRMALRVGDAEASRVAVGGSNPRADRLFGCGDCYAVGPQNINRVQVAYVDADDINREPGREPEFVEWPVFTPEEIGQDIPGPGRPVSVFTNDQIAVALISAAMGEGRGKFEGRLRKAGLQVPGTDNLRRLLEDGKAIRNRLDSLVEWEISGEVTD
ncbi:MAG: FtsK/SpoIIIE domain-containing protein [Planctomycetaceae bacterium]